MSILLWFLTCGKGREQRVAISIMIPYLFLVFVATLFERRVGNDFHIILTPLWKVQAIMNGGVSKAWFKKEILMNILLLMPVGVFAPVFFKGKRFLYTIMTGIGTSIIIELLQFITRRGFAEIDDIIFNTLGVLVGFGIYSVFQRGLIYTRQ